MGPTRLLGALRKKPFEPFRLVTSDGTCYDIRAQGLPVVEVPLGRRTTAARATSLRGARSE
jgi:hypothetical protein